MIVVAYYDPEEGPGDDDLTIVGPFAELEDAEAYAERVGGESVGANTYFVLEPNA